ncbi:hypothetical protein H0R92_10770 [Treponema sp. OMZ 840]|uniref:tetratricopeptide repeat protein n=1 Tax=Treponema sp. OMZ 840 TaxID=244313 RepID=UPI003D94CB26
MQSDTLKKAERLLASRRFSEVINLLEPMIIDYRESFYFHYMLGTACLYVGDIGGAELYYKKARNLKMTDPRLINALAVLFLRRGEINKAVEYYLEAQEYDSENRTAKNALNFIKKNSNPENLVHYVRSGKIKRLYPPLGVRPALIYGMSVFIAAVVFVSAGAFFMFKSAFLPKNDRADLSSFALTVDEKQNALVQDTASSVFRCVLTKKELEKAYADAQLFFQKYRDNAAQVEINRILNSNASAAIRQKARLLMDYLTEPGFDTVTDIYTYAQIHAEPWLYMGCWIVWAGRVTNTVQTPSEYRCDFLIGYDTMERMEGIVPLVLKQPVEIDTALPVTVLAKVGSENGKLILQGKSVHQPLPEK